MSTGAITRVFVVGSHERLSSLLASLPTIFNTQLAIYKAFLSPYIPNAHAKTEPATTALL